MVKRVQTVGTRSYLFCVGFEVLGGILLKLGSSCLDGFFLPSCKSLKACEVEALVDAEEEGGRASGRPSTCALFRQADRRRRESRRTEAAGSAKENAFIVVVSSL